MTATRRKIYAPNGEYRTTVAAYTHCVMVDGKRRDGSVVLSMHRSFPAAAKAAAGYRRDGWTGVHTAEVSATDPNTTVEAYTAARAAGTARPAATPAQPAEAAAPARKVRVKADRWDIVGKRSGRVIATVDAPGKGKAEHAAMKMKAVREFAARETESWVAVPAAA